MGNIQAHKRLIVFTPNPEFVLRASQNKAFADLLAKADINIADGVGLVWAGRLLGVPVRRIAGADIVAELLKIGNQESWRVGIAGARGGDRIEQDVQFKKLVEKYPNLKFENLDIDFKFKIKNLKFDMVFACQGMVKQEEWIWENKDKYDGALWMGIGGSLDYLSGFIQRAPLLIRLIGFEWAWRLVTKPGHWRRVWRAVVEFGWLVLKEELLSLKAGKKDVNVN